MNDESSTFYCRRHIYKVRLYFFLSLFIFSCSGGTVSTKCEYSRFEDVFYDVLDSLSVRHDVTGRILIIPQVEDNIQALMLTGLVEKYPDAANNELVLARELIDAKNDSLPICFEERNRRNYSLLFKEESLIDFNYEAQDYFGSVIVSDIRLTESGDYRGFYIAINCGECSAGYVAFIQKNESEGTWSIDKINKVWGGSG